MKSKSVLITSAVILVLVLLLGWSRFFPADTKPVVVDPNTLPGIQKGEGPWVAELSALPDRLRAIGLQILPTEGSALHVHAHLDLVINGSTTPVAGGIGVDQTKNYISPVHTHNEPGIIHIESPTKRDFTLGEFFDVWGVRFTKDCIGGYCSNTGHMLSVYSNGQAVQGDPRNLVLKAHEQIVVVYAAASSTQPALPTYTFPSNL